MNIERNYKHTCCSNPDRLTMTGSAKIGKIIQEPTKFIILK